MSRTDVHTPAKFLTLHGIRLLDPHFDWEVWGNGVWKAKVVKHFRRTGGAYYFEDTDRGAIPTRAQRKRDALREIASQLED